MAKVMVTGSAGFIAGHLVDKLIAEGHEVIGVDDLSGGVMENVNPKSRFFREDLRSVSRIERLFEAERPEIVFHLGCNAAENKAQFSPIDITSRNYSAFINTLTPFIKYGGKRFIFTSSIAVYGALQTPFKETDKPEPEDLYGITKLAAEQTLKVMSEVHGFEYVIARPHNVYGPRQNMRDPYRNVVTIWMNSILRGDSVYIYGDGSQVRQFSYIDDVVDQLAKCLELKEANKTFNIGSRYPTTLKDLFYSVQHATGYSIDPIYLPLRPQEVMEAIADHTESEKWLGFAKERLGTGLGTTWEWVKEQGPQVPIYTPLELESDKIPQNWLK